ncbi:MAG: ATP-binding protein [Planctomycetota bacterium]|nr:ATP-binding protein [Planctomycetota bacterium]
MNKIPKALRKFLLGYLLLHFLAAALLVWILTSLVRERMIADARLRMTAMSQILIEHIGDLDQGFQDETLPQHLKTLGMKTGYRYTLITADGIVTCDSDTGTEDTGFHGDRPEVMDAERHRLGFSERYSKTLEKPMMYLALPYEPGRNASRGSDRTTGYVRVAIPAVSINDAIGSLQAYVWIFTFFVSGLTALIMSIFASRTLQPLNLFSRAAKQIGEGSYDAAPSMLGRADEWGLLAEAFRTMQQELEKREVGLVKNSARQEAVLGSMIEGVISVEPDETVMLANRAACRMLNMEATELVGRKLLDVVRVTELASAIEEARKNDYSKTEFQTLSPNRKTISARVSVLTPTAEVEPGRQSGLAIVLHDITELRQLETMRRDFVANVSHELKTPLSSILAYAETLRLGALDDNTLNLQFVEQIEDQAHVLNQQIADLLQLARVESGNEVWEFMPVDINDVCAASIRQFDSAAKKQKIELRFEPDKTRPMAYVDTDGLLTIVNNLVSNAIHYTPEGGRVTLSTSHEHDHVLVVVEDSGIGIAPEHHARIFERFYRVDKARSRDKGGTGLGLAIVKHMVQSFSGSVELESQLGRGTTFRVILPRHSEPL